MSETAKAARHTDSRVVGMQVERAAKTLKGAIACSPPWAAFAAFLCSGLMPGSLGAVPFARGAAFIAVIVLAACATELLLRRVLAAFARPDARTASDFRARLRPLLALNLLLSAAWGVAPWLLWRDGNAVNHVFIVLIMLAIVSRFLVNRANHTDFFLASFLPMAGLLFIRCVAGFNAADLVLAALIPIYAIQLLFDTRHISDRWDAEGLLRFSHQDMSRELAEARDEALTKRTEAETANASKTAFLANMSHELRTPLNAILGFSEIIAGECLGPVGSPRYRDYAGDIHSSGQHLLSLINDLLDVAKIEAGRMEIEPHMIETGRTLEAALRLLGVRARERNQTLTIAVAPDADVLYADERAVKQIVVNLVANAVKFTPEGGRIAVRARRDGAGDFELEVADNGAGIAPGTLERIFKPFMQADNRYDRKAGGTGLGLTLVRGLAEQHGGRAWAESEEGKGTSVFVVLPMTASDRRAKRSASAA